MRHRSTLLRLRFDMALIDLRTVMLMGFLFTAICTLVLLLLWRDSRRRYLGTGYWVADLSLITTAQLIVGLRGSIPDWLSIGFTNPLTLAGAFLGLLGFSRFTGTPIHRKSNAVIILLLVLLNTVFIVVRPDIAFRNLILAVGLVILCFQSAWILLKPADPALRSSTKRVGAIFVMFVAVNLLRVFAFFIPGQVSADFYQLGAFQTGIIITYQVLLIMMTYGMVMMVNQRLFRDLKVQEERFSKAFHSSPYAILLTRFSDGKVIDVNAGFEIITGYRASEVLGKTTVDLGLWGEENTREVILRQLNEKGKFLNAEMHLHRKNGERITGLVSADTFDMDGTTIILSSINDISRRKVLEEDRERLLSELKEAMANMKTMSGLIPICASCKKIRDDKGFWNQLELYISEHSEATFSHGICPECLQRDYPRVFNKMRSSEQ